MRINKEEHLKHPWRVHRLLTGFEIEDVWLLPILMSSQETISEVGSVLSKALGETASTGATGALFKLRFFLGRVFGWDDDLTTKVALPHGSIRERYAEQEHLEASDFSATGFGDFVPVYDLSVESLMEIENKTVHAALHLAKVPLGKDHFGVHMTVYAKPKGVFGAFYMHLIKPFRLYIVYPFMLKLIGGQWKKYQLVKSASTHLVAASE